MTCESKPQKFSPEVRERAVGMATEHRDDHASQWAAITSIAAKIGRTAQSLSSWVKQAERDQGKRAGHTTDERGRSHQRERENRELRQANEIRRRASAYFAQAELDRLWKIAPALTAINEVTLDGTDGPSQKWLPEDKVAALYQKASTDKTIDVYDHDGLRMSQSYMQLKSLGCRDVRLCNGGWSHWSNKLTLPVVEGAEPWSEGFNP